MSRIAPPALIAQANTHRLVIHEPDRGPPDAERLADLYADGLAAARRALAILLPPEAREALELPACTLRATLLEERDLLSTPAQGAMEAFLGAAATWAARHGATPAVEAAAAGVAEALEMSHRVEDLLAAEIAIAARRWPASPG